MDNNNLTSCLSVENVLSLLAERKIDELCELLTSEKNQCDPNIFYTIFLFSNIELLKDELVSIYKCASECNQFLIKSLLFAEARNCLFRLQSKNASASELIVSKRPLSKANKRLFIDCGGHDGCSVVKYLLKDPFAEVITFEANSDLTPYYDRLPTQLINKAVCTYNGEIDFIIDSIDADGSTFIETKNVDFSGRLSNRELEKRKVSCIDLAAFIRDIAKNYDSIDLKLDVEGAEYSILESFILNDTFKYINTLYIEFHWHKMGLSAQYHNEIHNKVSSRVDLRTWDAHEFSIHGKSNKVKKQRHQIVEHLCAQRK